MKIQLKELLAREIAALGTPRRALSCNLGASVEEVLLTMRKEKMGSIVVLSDSKIQGIFTERDLLEKIPTKGVDLSHIKIDSYMTPNPVRAKRHEQIGEVLNRMRAAKLRHIVIVDAYDHLEKVVSMREILGYLMDPLTVPGQAAA